jgi:diguanylate cyclase (GGDEF)-like protein/PAS domain S-box-containing protein
LARAKNPTAALTPMPRRGSGGAAALADSQQRLHEAEETLRAIRHGEVDALVVSGSDPGGQVFTLSSADRPYRIFVENMQEGAATLSDAGVILFANQRLAELLGCPTSALVARRMSEFVAEHSRPELSGAIGTTLVGTTLIGMTLEIDLQRPDGQPLAALVGISRLDVDDERLTCLTFTDRTAEQRLLLQVRASQQRYEALYRDAPVPAYTWENGPSGLVLTDFNEAALRLTGGAVADALGSTAAMYYRDHPALLADLTRCLGGQLVVERETVSRAAGHEQHLHVTMVPVPPTLAVVHTEDVTESWLAEQALRESEERFRLLVDGVHDYAILSLDVDGRVTSWNAGAELIKGYRPEEILGRHFSIFFPSGDVAAGKPDEALRIAGAAGRYESEGWRIRKNGTRFWANVVVTALYDDRHRLRGFGKVTRDFTERRAAEQALRASEERYRSIVENAQEGISILDGEGRFTFANPRTAELLGRDVTSLTGLPASALLGPHGTESEGSSPAPTQYEATTIRPDGSSVDLMISTAPLRLSGSGLAGSLCMMSDISVRREAEEKLAHWALHDPLTGLPNRTLLMDRVDQALSRVRRQPGTVAALFCDLDGFKEVNDSYGHHVGDELLQAVAGRLQAAVRPADTVARIGGDEFVVLCEDLADEGAAFGLAARVLSSVAEPLHVAGHELPLTVSVGVALALSADAGELLRNADAAMYLAKQRGRNRAELFDETLRKLASKRLDLIGGLRHAVARAELRVHYQPVLSLEGEGLLGLEALVRWEHPTHGLLLPDQFIPAAESANLIGDIGTWVLQTACRQSAIWARAGPHGTALHMAVNVSARQLSQGSRLVQIVADALRDADIDPGTLVLEVTESVVMDDAEATLAILTELKGLGVKLAIDDFGTGYSSLVYLKRFPVDQLKVDRTFVGGLGENPDDSAIVASIVGLARAVGIGAVAEGVETNQQLAVLKGLGCASGQGFLWSRARPAAEVDELIRTGACVRMPRARTRLT